ncbi:hypothetical protein NDU88_004217 [Pleurodeles waltl]|uniref:Uncharacterized protein n=1 Tax=Pleurodeles waltl TaxID=8319 RepID=A0AAV7QBM0_PLEWA|nr:hypothetical protein NDU88_004217 [Pleurodeles waltl]
MARRRSPGGGRVEPRRSGEAAAADPEWSVSCGPARADQVRGECPAAKGGSQRGGTGLGSGPLPPTTLPFYPGQEKAEAAAPAPWSLCVPPRSLLHGEPPAQSWGLRAALTGPLLWGTIRKAPCSNVGEGARHHFGESVPGCGCDIGANRGLPGTPCGFLPRPSGTGDGGAVPAGEPAGGVCIKKRTDVGEGKEKSDQEQEDGEDADSSRSKGRRDGEGRNQRNGDDEEKTPQAGATKETSPRNSGAEQTEAEKCGRRKCGPPHPRRDVACPGR